jgi:very-short-patch-repair endonuclease/DNA-binding CsgD family transcriptional regulator
MTEEESYSLKKSSQGQLKQLYPILLDAHGNVIDGFHRKEADENWPTLTLGHIDSTVKLELARLASNFCRRNVPFRELEQKIGFLIGAGLKVKEIADQTGISERTIYRHMPEQLKKPEAKAIGEAMKEKSEIVRKELTSLTAPEVANVLDKIKPTYTSMREAIFADMRQCEKCGAQFHRSKGSIINGKIICPKCSGEGKPIIREHKVEVKPVFKEAWEHRVAQMHPQHSKMENELLVKLQGLGAMTDKLFCLQSTTPDFYFPKQKLAVYVDGPVHKGKEERDSYLRDLLTKRHQVRVVAIPYLAFSKQEVERVFEQIKEALT